MAATDTTAHVIQAETQTQYETAVAQLDDYAERQQQPPLLNRADDAENLRITFTQVAVLDLGE